MPDIAGFRDRLATVVPSTNTVVKRADWTPIGVVTR